MNGNSERTPAAEAGRSRRITGLALTVIGATLLAYHVMTVWIGLHGAMQHYTLHLGGVLTFAAVWLLHRAADPMTGTSSLARQLDRIAGSVGGVLALAASIYLYRQAEMLEIMQPFVGSTAIGAGVAMVAAVLLIAWRLWGTVIALVCLAAVLYLTLGHLLPEPLAARQQPFNVAVSFLGGIGGPRGVLSYASLSADMIFLLLVYGGLLHATGVIRAFGELGLFIGGFLRGGVAYSAIVASTLIGMVTGQAVSNIALSGVMTIPTMKRNGFSAEQAGAIEVMASTGSQLLPPIMGLGAFLMAVILGVSYIDIVLAGLIPGILYMSAIVIGLSAMVGRQPRGVPHENRTDWREIAWVLPAFVVSFAALIILLVLRYSPAMAGFWGGTLVLALSFLRPRAYRPRLPALRAGCLTGLEAAVQLAVVLAAIGIVVQTLTTTGLGVSSGRLIAELSDGSLGIALVLGMLVSLVVGMGLPTPAAYALIAIVVVPSLIDAGLTPLAANMYGFYFAIFSALTPPVAVGILVATRISGGSFLGSVREAARLGCCAMAVPFLFVSMPSLLAPDALTLQAATGILVFLICSLMTSGALFGALWGPLQTRERVGFLLVGPPGLALYLVTHALWAAVLPVLLLGVWWWSRRRNAAVPDDVPA